MLWLQPSITEEAKILHISSFRNPSYLFTDKVLEYIAEKGLEEWVKSAIINPTSTFLPFDYQVFYSSCSQRRRWRKGIASFLKDYGRCIDSTFEDFQMPSRMRPLVINLLQNNHFESAMRVWMIWKYLHLHLKKRSISNNICHK